SGGEDWVQQRLAAFRDLKDTDFHFPGPSGAPVWINVRRYRTSDGGTLLIRSDVTERKRVEAQAQSAQRRLADAIESIADGIALYDKDERIVLFNKSYRDSFGSFSGLIEPGILFGDLIRSLFEGGYYADPAPDQVAKRIAEFRALEDVEVTRKDPQGDRHLQIRYFRTADGGTLAVRRCVTEQRRIEEQARTAQQRLADAIESIADGIALYDKDEKLVLMNAVYRRAVGLGGTRPSLGDTFEAMTRRLVAAGHYAQGKGEEMLQERIRRFRALESMAMAVHEPDGLHHLRVRHYRARDGGTLIVRADVTEQQRAEDQARSAQQRLTDALEGIKDAVVLYDKDERLVMFNRPYVADMSLVADIIKPGLQYETLIRALIKAGYYRDVGEPDAWLAERLRRFRALEDTEIETVLPDGARRWRDFRHYRTKDGGTLMVRMDITERKQAEERLQAVQQRLTDALDSSGDGMALFDKDERLVLFNEHYARTIPGAADFLKAGMKYRDLVEGLVKKGLYVNPPPGWVETRLKQFRGLETAEFAVHAPEGWRWVVVRHFRTRDGGTFLVRSDITERKQAEERLQAVQQRLSDALDSSGDGMVLFDKDERLVLFNETYRRVFAHIPAAI
ncbi:MAG: PAS domain-containing protein, partial [Alphaproteobacteria bacterium]|nr:PAS domain-containing protein [Alphaproteobacteria bacterium]